MRDYIFHGALKKGPLSKMAERSTDLRTGIRRTRVDDSDKKSC